MICARCNRILLRPPVVRGGMSFGPKCAAAVIGPVPRRARASMVISANRARRPDGRQGDLFSEVRL